MPTPTRTPRREPNRFGTGAALAGIGTALLVIVCCAGPALIAAGGLAGLGAWLSNPWVIAAAAVMLVAALTTTVVRRRSGRHTCCPPPHTVDRADRDRPA